MELAKAFDPHAIESRWYPFWESHGYFTATFYLNPSATLEANRVYSLFLLGDGSVPPALPNVGILVPDR